MEKSSKKSIQPIPPKPSKIDKVSLGKNYIDCKIQSNFSEGIFGNIDFFSAAGVGGWALNFSDPKTPILLEAKLGGVVIGSGKTMGDRPDVAKIAKVEGKFGYQITWQWDKLAASIKKYKDNEQPPIEIFTQLVPYPILSPARPTAGEIRQWVKLAKKVTRFSGAIWIEPDLFKANAAIDRFGVIPDRKGLLAGWAIMQPGWEVWVQDGNGNTETLKAALRYQREDIGKVFFNQYGQHVVDAGFVMQWPHQLQIPQVIRILAYHPTSRQAFEICKATPEEVSGDPEAYARWAFSVYTPVEKFDERLNCWEGRFIGALLAERRTWFETHGSPPKVWDLGIPPAAPTISLIIPLYSRWDFVEHQLLAFTQDQGLRDTTEIIYVVDDPSILSAVLNEVENLYQMYEVPFKVVWGHRNRGFSGANNLAVSKSQGRHVLLLNSDAFPKSRGWANRISELLDLNPEYGLLGARLLNPEGGLQHSGMTFFYSSLWQVWLNMHPLPGLASDLDLLPLGVDILEKPAVTGACMIISRALFEEVGGLDEGYLIGDFEDSDLCLKVMQHGYRIGYVPSVELVHLERQSFSEVGDVSFRTLVVRFNAWRHTQRWGIEIKALMDAFNQRK